MTELARLRGAAGLSSGQLAKMLNITPVKYLRIETGEHEPSLSIGLALAAAFDRQPTDLFYPSGRARLASEEILESESDLRN